MAASITTNRSDPAELSMGLFGFGKKAKDPVCGMDVDPKSAAGTATHGGKTYYFCSTSCQSKFKANPAQFV
jgi:YHS domain-containing protein